MFTSHPRTITDLAAFGVKIDQEVTNAMALLDAARATTLRNPTGDLAAAYDAGTLTLDNIAEQITTAATIAAASERVHLAANTIEQCVHGTIRAWIRANADTILKTLRPQFDQAAAIVQVAAKHFAPGATDKQILAGGSPAVVAHEKLAAALMTLGQIRALRVNVGECARWGEQDASWYITGAKDMADLDRAHFAYTGTGDGFHALAYAGFTLRLNTPAEAAKVAAGAQATTDQAEAKAREERAAVVTGGWPSWSDPAGATV